MMTVQDFERTAQEYMDSLTLEQIMEATPHAKQRAITVESFDLLRAYRPDLQHFNELLIQAELEEGILLQVVPDNMAILTEDEERDRTSFVVNLEKARPFWVLEYVSKSSRRKDYEDNFKKYDILEVPYYLTFDPEQQDLRIFRYNGEGYVRMEPDTRGRYRIDRLDVEVGLLGGWVRFWYKGERLLLPGELAQALAERQREVQQQADILQHKDEALAEHSAALVKRGEELKQKDEQLAAEQAARAAREQALQQKDEQLKKKDEELAEEKAARASREQALQQKEEALTRVQERDRQLAALLQPQVAERARRAGREDILAQLAGTFDLGQLTAWLAELS